MSPGGRARSQPLRCLPADPDLLDPSLPDGAPIARRIVGRAGV